MIAETLEKGFEVEWVSKTGVDPDCPDEWCPALDEWEAEKFETKEEAMERARAVAKVCPHGGASVSVREFWTEYDADEYGTFAMREWAEERENDFG